MPRAIPVMVKLAMLAQQTGTWFGQFVEFDLSAIGLPAFRLCSDNVQRTLLGKTFLPAYLKLTLPSDDPQTAPQTKLEVENIDGALLQGLLQLPSRTPVTIWCACDADPNAIIGPSRYQLAACDWTNQTLQITLAKTDLINRAYPAQEFTPYLFPAAFP